MYSAGGELCSPPHHPTSIPAPQPEPKHHSTTDAHRQTQIAEELSEARCPGSETLRRLGALCSLQVVLTSTLLHLNTLILFTTNLKLHTTAFAFMRLCYCFYLVFTTAVELFVFAQILPRPSTFTQHRGAHQLRTRSGINRLLLARSLRRHQ